MAVALIKGHPAVIAGNMRAMFPQFAEPLGAMVAWLHTDADDTLKPLFDACWLVYEAVRFEEQKTVARAREDGLWTVFGFGSDDLTDMQQGYARNEEW